MINYSTANVVVTRKTAGKLKEVPKKPSSVLSQYVIWSSLLEHSLVKVWRRVFPIMPGNSLNQMLKMRRHDLALGYTAAVHNVNDKDEKEGNLLRDAWISHPDHTITKALVAERAIFFVLLPFFRIMVAALRTVSADISGRTDPCRSNSLVCQSWVFSFSFFG